jgi:2-polyprenyl-3-methyl-5-hydroxy-6-metoxy-1,4-benzoquinol methylase
MKDATCRFCAGPLHHVHCDLGMSPLANSYVPPEQLNAMEPFYPLRTLVCERCFLVQLEEFVAPDGIFSDYLYFSSFSTSWLDHARRYVEMAIDRFELDGSSKVVEIASNDGYLLQYFVEHGIPSLGVEPAANVAEVAVEKGIPTTVQFFGVETARELARDGQADLLLGNNVLAHVPDLNDFVAGMKLMLKPGGVLTMEFPHLMRLMEELQYDTIYHEHFSYFSFSTVSQVFAAHGMTLFDVEELTTHGGSLRIFGRHAEDASKPVTERAQELLEREEAAGYRSLDLYLQFDERVRSCKRDFLEFLIGLKREGRTIAGFGAPAKGNTMLNYCGIGRDFLDFTVEDSPYKQGLYLPGTHIPILGPEAIAEAKPDVVLILPWNIKRDIMQKLSYIAEWGGQFATPEPGVALAA